jgi:hypothetical protein
MNCLRRCWRSSEAATSPSERARLMAHPDVSVIWQLRNPGIDATILSRNSAARGSPHGAVRLKPLCH